MSRALNRIHLRLPVWDGSRERVLWRSADTALLPGVGHLVDVDGNGYLATVEAVTFRFADREPSAMVAIVSLSRVLFHGHPGSGCGIEDLLAAGWGAA